MNYQKFKTFDEFLNVVKEGVKIGWFDPKFKTFWTKFDLFAKYIYDKAKNIPKEDQTRKVKINGIYQEVPLNYCPEAKDILKMLKVLEPDEINVLIIGQDPYPRLTSAVGIAFQDGEKGAKSLSLERIKQNLIKFGHMSSSNNCYSLMNWVKQGVFLINTTFTTEEGESAAHTVEWDGLISDLLKALDFDYVSILLGDDAQKLAPHIKSDYKIKYCHPAIHNPKEFEKVDIFGIANKHLDKIKGISINWAMI